MESVTREPESVEHKPWQFKPGVSGNPGGRPRKSVAQRAAEQMSREAAQKAIESLMGESIEVLRAALKGDDAALACRTAESILDRSLGKSVQRVLADVNASDNTRVASPELLRMAAMRLLSMDAQDADH